MQRCLRWSDVSRIKFYAMELNSIPEDYGVTPRQLAQLKKDNPAVAQRLGNAGLGLVLAMEESKTNPFGQKRIFGIVRAEDPEVCPTGGIARLVAYDLKVKYVLEAPPS